MALQKIGLPAVVALFDSTNKEPFVHSHSFRV